MTNKQKPLSPLNLYRLGIDNAYGLMQSSIDVATKAASGLDPMTLQALAYLRQCHQQLAANLKVSVSPEWTRQLQALGQECLHTWAAVRRTVRYYKQDGTTEEQEAARQLWLFLTPYSNISRQPLNTRAALLQELMGKYQTNEVLLEAADTLGIYKRMEALETVNDAFALTYLQRNETMAKRHSAGTNNQLCRQALQAYRRFCSMLEQAYLYTGSQPTLGLILEINGYRDKYKAIVARKSHKGEVAVVPSGTAASPLATMPTPVLPEAAEAKDVAPVACLVATDSVEPVTAAVPMVGVASHEVAEQDIEAEGKVANEDTAALVTAQWGQVEDAPKAAYEDVLPVAMHRHVSKQERKRQRRLAMRGVLEGV